MINDKKINSVASGNSMMASGKYSIVLELGIVFGSWTGRGVYGG